MKTIVNTFLVVSEYAKKISAIIVKITSLDKRTHVGSCFDVGPPPTTTTPSDEPSCTSAGKTWSVSVTTPSPVRVCMRIYYRKNGVIADVTSTNTEIPPHVIIENGTVQSISFEFDSDVITAGVQDTTLPNGINSFGIFTSIDHDTNPATPDQCQFTPYPSTAHALQQVLFAPYKSVDNLYW